jgi:hypothetical protein
VDSGRSEQTKHKVHQWLQLEHQPLAIKGPARGSREMSEERRQEFRSKVKAVHDAADEYAEGFASGDWFQRDLDGRLRKAVEELLAWGVTRRRGGIKEVTDEYLLTALGWPLIRRYDLTEWLTRALQIGALLSSNATASAAELR